MKKNCTCSWKEDKIVKDHPDVVIIKDKKVRIDFDWSGIDDISLLSKNSLHSSLQ